VAKLAFPNALAELRGMTEAVTTSDLDYTIAWITSPTGKAATGRIRSGFLGHDRIGPAHRHPLPPGHARHQQLEAQP
jgi:hypothetical protein